MNNTKTYVFCADDELELRTYAADTPKASVEVAFAQWLTDILQRHGWRLE